jgi:hypothetical protein
MASNIGADLYQTAHEFLWLSDENYLAWTPSNRKSPIVAFLSLASFSAIHTYSTRILKPPSVTPQGQAILQHSTATVVHALLSLVMGAIFLGKVVQGLQPHIPFLLSLAVLTHVYCWSYDLAKFSTVGSLTYRSSRTMGCLGAVSASFALTSGPGGPWTSTWDSWCVRWGGEWHCYQDIPETCPSPPVHWPNNKLTERRVRTALTINRISQKNKEALGLYAFPLSSNLYASACDRVRILAIGNY